MTHKLNEKAHCESHMLILASILYLLKSPSIILCNPVFKNNFSTWYTAYWLVPTVSNPSVHIPQVETLKPVEQWHIALKQRRTHSPFTCHRSVLQANPKFQLLIRIQKADVTLWVVDMGGGESTALNLMITDEGLIGKYSEGSSEGLIEVLSLHFSAGTRVWTWHTSVRTASVLIKTPNFPGYYHSSPSNRLSCCFRNGFVKSSAIEIFLGTRQFLLDSTPALAVINGLCLW